ncbi:hypothetical protein [Microcystis phage Mae-JY35]
MSYADMFRANNLPVEQQVARIQAPQMPQFDLSQFFSMMPRQPVQAPQPAAAPPVQQSIYEPGMAITLAPGFAEMSEKMRGGGMPMSGAAPMPQMQASKFPSQAQMASQALNSKAASLSGGK